MGGSLSIDEIQALYKEYPEYGAIDTFIETGTLHGGTVNLMKGSFPHCHTIELSPQYYEETSKRLAHTGINFHHGDSVSVLKKILPAIQKPILFFLDAHFSSGNTARGSKDCPLLEEMELITLRGHRDVVIIDDLRLFGTKGGEDWSEVTTTAVMDIVGRKGFKAYFFANDRMFVLY